MFYSPAGKSTTRLSCARVGGTTGESGRALKVQQHYIYLSMCWTQAEAPDFVLRIDLPDEDLFFGSGITGGVKGVADQFVGFEIDLPVVIGMSVGAHGQNGT